MKRKILWMLVSFLLVAALVLASCGEPVPGEQEEEEAVPGEQEEEEEEEEEEPAVGEPQYGDTLTLWADPRAQTVEPPSPDTADGYYTSLTYLEFMQEGVLCGDIEKYGPRGTNEYQFWHRQYQPMEYLTGNMVESWELHPDRFVFHVRPGVYWAPTEHQSAWMEARELTAEDLADDMNRVWKAPWGTRYKGFITDIYAEDDTVVVELENYSRVILYYLCWEDRAVVSPPEVHAVPGRAKKWENQVGSGPFMFEEYVTGSHMKFKRNPNYWKTTTINGKEYQLPFLDHVVLPIIPDPSTQIAAVRTGVLDLYRIVPIDYWDTLDMIAPELERWEGSVGTEIALTLRVDEPPFDDPEVRYAVTFGTDMDEFQSMVGSTGLQKDYFPCFADSPIYMPPEELPAEIREMRKFEYEPELARQMLADAGYPIGFKTMVLVRADQPEVIDAMALLKDQWTRIGVELTLDVRDTTTYTKMYQPVPPDMTVMYHGLCANGEAHPDALQKWPLNFMITSSDNTAVMHDPEFDELLMGAQAEMDIDEQNKILKECGEILAVKNFIIPLTLLPARNTWWPWVMNYYGETSVADDAQFCGIVKFIWIDQVLKAKMGY